MNRGEATPPVTFLTGGGSGIGRAVLDRLVADGGRVGVLDASSDNCHAVEEAYRHSDVVQVYEGDVRRPGVAASAIGDTVDCFGRLDHVIANAGVYDNNRELASLSEAELLRAFDDIHGVNVLGHMLTVRAALPHLRKTSGSVVFTASVSSARAGYGGFLYVSSKHALAGLVRQLGLELAPDIRVIGVAPGYVETALRAGESLGGEPTSADPQRIAAHLPLGVVPSPAQYAGLYAFLLSDDAALMTGTIVTMDAGLELVPMGRD